MWFSGKERRRYQRREVCWEGLLHYTLPEFQKTLNISVVDISSGGAKLHSPTIQAGPFHLVAFEQSPQLELAIVLPEGNLKIDVKILWYKLMEDKTGFAVGVKFIDLSEEMARIIKNTIG